MNDLVIYGAGSVGCHVAANLKNYKEDFNLIGFIDDNVDKHGKEYFGAKVFGGFDRLGDFKEDVQICIGIAFPTIKKKIIDKLNTIGHYNFPTFISKNAWISENVIIGEGVIIYPGTSINYNCIIDNFVVMNMNCAIGHECEIGQYSSLAPGVNLGGNTKIGSLVDIGIGATTKQGIQIGGNSIIGGLTMLIQDVGTNSTVVGVPGKQLSNYSTSIVNE
jgi:sugar O-acyltransferase (sialic acid O-acetyltransferase NeuD family)